MIMLECRDKSIPRKVRGDVYLKKYEEKWKKCARESLDMNSPFPKYINLTYDKAWEIEKTIEMMLNNIDPSLVTKIDVVQMIENSSLNRRELAALVSHIMMKYLSALNGEDDEQKNPRRERLDKLFKKSSELSRMLNALKDIRNRLEDDDDYNDNED